MVTPLPGISRMQLSDSLRQLHTEAFNIWNGSSGSGPQQLARYVGWAAGAVRVLGPQIRPEDMNRLILTRGYDRLLTLVQPMASAEMVSIMNELLNVELTQRLTELETTRKSLDDLATRWPGNRVFVLPDTSIYVEHKDSLEDLDFTTLVDLVFADTTVHVFMPIVVIDEMDGLKDYQPASVRASYTLAHIDKLFPQPGRPVLVRPPAPDRLRGAVVMELVFDPPGHARLPIEDDEIVDRALALQALTGSSVTLATFDTNHSTRARNAGLPTNRLPDSLKREKEKSRRQERREKATAREQTEQSAQAANDSESAPA